MRLEYFEMIDSVEELDAAGGHIVATARVPLESPVFEGHFPTFPIVPGVILLEAMNQAAGFMVLAFQKWRRFPFFAGASKVKCRQFVKPGEVLTLNADLAHDGSGFAIATGKVKVNGKTAAEAEMTFTLQDFPSPDFVDLMLVRARAIGLPIAAVG
jgi:3-hydroxyacyl-[acyl-carrier-protein] dehydratase